MVETSFSIKYSNMGKAGLMVGVLRFREEDRALIDTEVATLTAG